uniref:WRKY19-like zinc finger domain-containing protein n=1 Tax=Arundo donax TaxID=35708 RepID=A0A0A9D0K9_ARUDO
MDRASPNLGSGDDSNSLNNLCHWNTVQQAVEYKDTAFGTLVHSNFSTPNPRALKRKWVDMAGVEGPENSLLTLGLGRSTSLSDNSKVSSPTACTMSPSLVKETDEESSIDLGLNFDLCLGHDMVHHHKKSAGAEHVPSASGPKLDLQLSLSTGSPESAVTIASTASLNVHDGLETILPNSVTDIAGKQSEPSSWFFGPSMPSSSYASEATHSFSLPMTTQMVDDPSPDVSSAITASVKSLAACTSGVANPHKHNTNTKCCQFPGCEKGARGASGHCIAHGGGRRCQKPGCQKGAEGRTIYCKAHGGGRRCQFLGCTKSAEGRTDHCIAHGGGRRCSQEGCSRAARGKSGLCIKHGGGKRCQRENCKRSAEGYSGLCISHGGGRRCQFPECTKGAQGSTKFCKAHGGGKRCTFLGCTKGAEGSTSFCKGHGGGKRCSYQGGGVCPKSVHGGTQYCVAHGGGKRCSVSGCTKSARGRTEYCVRHGGGKRCKFEGCAKSAQGSTDFCKAHGGGKRCSWGQDGSSFGVGGPPCDKFARSKIGLCAAHSALIEDHCVHGGGSLGPAIKQFTTDAKPDEMKAAAAKGDVDMANGDGEAFTGWRDSGLDNSAHHPSVLMPSSITPFPEGRVHGRGLLALLSARTNVSGSSSENGASTSPAMRTWM